MIREHSMSTRNADADSSTPFIDLTVCPSYDFAYKTNVLKYFGLNKTAYRSHGTYINNDGSQSYDAWEIFNSSTHTINEILHYLTVVSRDRTNPRLDIIFNETSASNILNVTTKYWYNLGRCYSFHPIDKILKFGIIRFDFVSWIDIYIYFGYSGQFMHPNTKTKVSRFQYFNLFILIIP